MNFLQKKPEIDFILQRKKNSGLINLTAKSREAVSFISFIALEECDISEGMQINQVVLQFEVLEEALRIILAEGFQVNFIK